MYIDVFNRIMQYLKPIADSIVSPTTNSIWIFGYGSLVHRPGFEYTRKVQGYIKDWKRVWWQGSTDHRGTPEAPGRTVTLEKCEGAVTWGIAYELAGNAEEQAKTLKYLEWREKQYDVRELVHVYGHTEQLQVLQRTASTPGWEQTSHNTSSQECSSTASSSADISASASVSRSDGDHTLLVQGVLCYIASSDKSRNHNWLGPATQEYLATQIATAQGPSGANWEYVSRLADAMRNMGVHDIELFALEAAVLAQRKALGLDTHREGHHAQPVATHSAKSFPQNDWRGAVAVIAGAGMIPPGAVPPASQL